MAGRWDVRRVCYRWGMDPHEDRPLWRRIVFPFGGARADADVRLRLMVPAAVLALAGAVEIVRAVTAHDLTPYTVVAVVVVAVCAPFAVVLWRRGRSG